MIAVAGSLLAAAIFTRAVAEELPAEIDIERDIEEELFHRASLSTPLSSESLVGYYRLPIVQRRRGVDWWLMEQIDGSREAKFEGVKSPIDGAKVRLFGSSESYYAGVAAEYIRDVGGDLSLGLDLDLRTGRDCSVEGVFTNSLRPTLSLHKLFDNKSHLSISLCTPFSLRGMRSSAAQEAISLTGDRLYNPAWGLYQGKVRNSRLYRNTISSLSARYEAKVWNDTKLLILSDSEYGRRSKSQIGWYDAYNPTPDYYRKLPSYLSSTSLQSDVEELWRTQNAEYTQINWDRLCEINSLSQDGSAHYTQEWEVERILESRLTTLFESDFDGAFSFRYGAEIGYSQSRNFKEMEDLLGADYLLDTDQFIGDYAQMGNTMQNDLRHPNRRICVGDRFGYDYALRNLSLAALASAEYSTGRFTGVLTARVGESYISRCGYYEKERFAGAASYGESARITQSDSSIDVVASYNLGRGHQITLRAGARSLPTEAEELFIQAESANRAIEKPESQKINNLSLEYQLSRGDFKLRGEAYYLSQRNGVEVWSGYDDLSSTYTNIVVSGISQRSVGVELKSRYKASQRVSLEAGVTLGDYTYTSAPEVTLYDDTDMSLLSRSKGVAVEGCKVGNAPQVVVMCGADLFLRHGFILSANGSYTSSRYVTPSFVRRTERVIASARQQELAERITAQESLGSMLDVALGVTKIFYYAGGRRMTLHCRVDNLLGDRDRREYGYEAGRLLRGAGSSTTGSYYLQSSKYIYGVGRTIYLSASYSW